MWLLFLLANAFATTIPHSRICLDLPESAVWLESQSSFQVDSAFIIAREQPSNNGTIDVAEVFARLGFEVLRTQPVKADGVKTRLVSVAKQSGSTKMEGYGMLVYHEDYSVMVLALEPEKKKPGRAALRKIVLSANTCGEPPPVDWSLEVPAPFVSERYTQSGGLWRTPEGESIYVTFVAPEGIESFFSVLKPGDDWFGSGSRIERVGTRRPFGNGEEVDFELTGVNILMLILPIDARRTAIIMCGVPVGVDTAEWYSRYEGISGTLKTDQPYAH